MNAFTIQERFLTFQGEGDFMGKRAYFVRTYGCALKCSFCDSAGTWHPEYKDVMKHEYKTPRELAELVADYETVVITGGEPAHYDWEEFLKHRKYGSKLRRTRTHIETSGAFNVKGSFDWMTVSPKRSVHPLEINLIRADEFKLIIEEPDDIAYWIDIIVKTRRSKEISIWLHPEWSQRENPHVLKAISEAVKMSALNLRAGYQLHKLYRVDQLDPGCKPAVPLGGNETKGY